MLLARLVRELSFNKPKNIIMETITKSVQFEQVSRMSSVANPEQITYGVTTNSQSIKCKLLSL